MKKMKLLTAINLKQISLGLVFLLIGSAEYILNRPVCSTYMGDLLGVFRSSNFGINVYGFCGGVFPEFVHPFSFALITMAIFPRSKRRVRRIICLYWLLVELVFEIGQAFGNELGRYIPDFFNQIYILENTKGYFTNGTYDHLDILAIFLGISTAFIAGELTSKEGGEEHHVYV